jgi:hypothetical protein
MATQQRLLIGFYVFCAVAALWATFSQNIQLPTAGGPLGAYAAFVEGAKVNPAARSLAVDIGFLFLAAAAFMVIEARRLGVRFVWLYILGGFLIAISVSFPLFMIARERRLGPANKPDTPWSLTVSDVAGLTLVAAALLAICWHVLN